MKHARTLWQWLGMDRTRPGTGAKEPAHPSPPRSGLRDELLEVIHQIETVYQSQGRQGCLQTGFSGLDRLMGGARPGELIVVASVPGMGKTMLSLNIASHVALGGSGTVAIFTLDSTRQELTQRLLCSQSGVSLNRVRSGGLSATRDFPRLVAAASRLADASILVEDPAEPALGCLRGRIRELNQAHDLKLVIFDSFQLLCQSAASEATPSEVARELKRWAREFGAVVLVLAQLDAPPAHRDSGRPLLDDLSACRVVEQHADVVALLWRQDYFHPRPEDYDPDFCQASLIVAKNRHGALGEVPLLFRKEVPRFENRALEKAES